MNILSGMAVILATLLVLLVGLGLVLAVVAIILLMLKEFIRVWRKP